MGVPLRFSLAAGSLATGGYSIPRETFFSREIDLPEHGPRLLGELFAAASRSGPLSEQLRSALLKLALGAGEDATAALARSRAALGLGLGASPDVLGNLATIVEAAHRRKRIAMSYHTIGRDETTKREVDPYGVGYAGQAWNRGAWYMVGRCHLRAALRVFKLDRIAANARIVRAESDGPDFDRPANFDAREHLNKARFEMRGLAAALGGGRKRSEEVLVRFPSAVADAVRELVPSARVVEGAGAAVLLRFRVNDRRAFCRFLIVRRQRSLRDPRVAVVKRVGAVVRELVATEVPRLRGEVEELLVRPCDPLQLLWNPFAVLHLIDDEVSWTRWWETLLSPELSPETAPLLWAALCRAASTVDPVPGGPDHVADASVWLRAATVTPDSVKREWNPEGRGAVDLRVSHPTVFVLIENKVWSDLTGDQLERYAEVAAETATTAGLRVGLVLLMDPRAAAERAAHAARARIGLSSRSG